MLREFSHRAGQYTIVAILLIALPTAFFPTIIKVSAENIVCGYTITADTYLQSDLLACPVHGLIIGASGITLDCQGHTISGSKVFDSYGILVATFTDATIANCVLENFYYAVELEDSGFNTVTGNVAFENSYGFFLEGSSFNTITGNTALHSDYYGFKLNASHNNTLTSNRSEGGSIGYTSSGGISIINFSFNNTLISNTVTKSYYGIVTDSMDTGSSSLPSYNILMSNTVNQTYYGFTIRTSNTVFRNNTSCRNTYSGLYLVPASNNNLLEGNVVCRNSQLGIVIVASSGTIVRSNNIWSNGVGLEILSAADNLIYDNLFNNPINALQQHRMGGPDNSYNSWSIPQTLGVNIVGGEYLGGNFWTDYTGLDTNQDGLGDTVTPFTAGGRIPSGDLRPLCSPSGCPSEIKASFEMDWSDYDNSGRVDILDVASAASTYRQISPYWDLNMGAITDINDIAVLATHYDQSFQRTSFPGSGLPAGRMDSTWKQLCSLLPGMHSSYCQARI